MAEQVSLCSWGQADALTDGGLHGIACIHFFPCQMPGTGSDRALGE